MAIYQPESFFETTLASAITASASTIAVTTAPTITEGYMVIEASTSNREIIKYTGVSGTNLTGCVRGLATYGSDSSAGTGKAHAAGVDIANRNVHYYFAQYYDFLVGTSATGANTMMIGDDGTTSATNRLWKVDLSAHQPFWGLSASGKMVVSEDGSTSYVISAGGSGLGEGDAIDITAGNIYVSRLSTGGLALSADKLVVGTSSFIDRVSNAIKVDTTSAGTWSGAQTWAASSTFSASASFRASGTFESAVTFNGNIGGSSLALIPTSATTFSSADTERTGNQAAATKIKEITLNIGGYVTVEFQGKQSADLGPDPQAQVYVNGSAYGTLRTFGASTYVKYSESVIVNAGDAVQLYYNTADTHSFTCKNFRIYAIKTVTSTSASGDASIGLD